jgi:hypothetical protein
MTIGGAIVAGITSSHLCQPRTWRTVERVIGALH